jgi:predicted Fe-S protein YdhL (DUF1289 family)
MSGPASTDETVGPPLPPFGPEVPSPCTGVCRMDEARVHCVGCLRTIPEIKAWRTLGSLDKVALWRDLRERQALRGSSA